MANRKYYSNPLKIHKSLQKKDLRNVSAQLLQKFSSLLSKDDKLCSVCRKKLSELPIEQNTSASEQEFNEMPSQKEGSDVEVEVDLLNQSLSFLSESPFDKRKAERHPTYVPEKRLKVEESVRRKLDLVMGSSSGKQGDALQRFNVNCMPEVIQSLKEKYQQSSCMDQIRILTIFTTSMSVRKLMNEFDCSQRMAVQAHHILKEKRMLASPNPKLSRVLPEELKSLVIEYYHSDDMSRVLPEMDDFSYKTRTQGAVGSERMQLLAIIAHYWDELERYESEGGTQRQKWDLWEMIAAEFNNHPSVSVIRTPLQVKTLFKNMKTKARKYRQRIEESKTTGVTIEADPISETVLKLNKYQSRDSLNAVLEPLKNIYYLSRKSLSLPVLGESDQVNNFIPMIASSHFRAATPDDSAAHNFDEERRDLNINNTSIANENVETQPLSYKEDSTNEEDASPLSDTVEKSQVHTFGDISVTALSSSDKNSTFPLHLPSIIANLSRNKYSSDGPLEERLSSDHCNSTQASSSPRANSLKRPLSSFFENESSGQEPQGSTSCHHGGHRWHSKYTGTDWHCCCPEYHSEMLAMAAKEHEMRMALLAEEILCQRAERSLHEEERRTREQNALFRREERQDALTEHRARMKVIELECEVVQARIRNAERNSNNHKWLIRNGSKEV